MSQSTWCVRITASLLGVSGLLFGCPKGAGQAPADQVKEVLAAWKQRQEHVRGVRYRVKGEHVIPKGSDTDPTLGTPLVPGSPAEDVVCPKELTLSLDFKGNRYRLELVEQIYHSQKKALYPRVVTTVSDGKTVTAALPREANTSAVFAPSLGEPEYSITSGNLRPAAFQAELWPILLGHGVVPTLLGHVFPGRLKRMPDGGTLHVHGQGAHEGRACLVLRTQAAQFTTTTFDEFWVDRSRNCAVVRMRTFANGAAVMELDIRYQQTPQGHLLEAWSLTRMTGRGKTIYVERMRVEERTPDPSFTRQDFRIDVPIGALVRETTYGGSPDNIAMPPVSSQKLYRMERFGLQTEIVDGVEQRRRWPYLLAALLLATVLGALGWLTFRWKRRRPSGP